MIAELREMLGLDGLSAVHGLLYAINEVTGVQSVVINEVQLVISIMIWILAFIDKNSILFTGHDLIKSKRNIEMNNNFPRKGELHL